MADTVKLETVPLGRVQVPVRFGDQIITSLLYNHDANPVHHKPDHAIQWMLGLLSGSGFAEIAGGLGSDLQPEEATYRLGTKLLEQDELVVMPGIVLCSLCLERFIRPEEILGSITTTFTFPLLVPIKGGTEVTIEATEMRATGGSEDDGRAPRRMLVEAFGPNLLGQPARLMKCEALLYPAGSDPQRVYDEAIAPEFARISAHLGEKRDLPFLNHPAAISKDDRRRYCRIVGLERPITPLAWQSKIPRVLTEVMDHMKTHENYQREVNEYYAGREDEAARREAIRLYVEKEIKYRHLDHASLNARVDELMNLTQQLYARQHTVFDPRLFSQEAKARKPGTPFTLSLHLYDMRLRRGIHRFYTDAQLDGQPVFMGEAVVTGQPLVTRALCNFLLEINHAFHNLKLFDYRG
jgi:hypothetical protein